MHRHTRIVVVMFNLYNGNDFDYDDHRAHKGDVGNEKLDDQIVVTELRHIMSESGSMDKLDYMVAVRPMRAFVLDHDFEAQEKKEFAGVYSQ